MVFWQYETKQLNLETIHNYFYTFQVPDIVVIEGSREKVVHLSCDVENITNSVGNINQWAEQTTIICKQNTSKYKWLHQKLPIFLQFFQIRSIPVRTLQQKEEKVKKNLLKKLLPDMLIHV